MYYPLPHLRHFHLTLTGLFTTPRFSDAACMPRSRNSSPLLTKPLNPSCMRSVARRAPGEYMYDQRRTARFESVLRASACGPH